MSYPLSGFLHHSRDLSLYMKTSLRSFGRIAVASSSRNPLRFAVLIPQLSVNAQQVNRLFHSSVVVAIKKAAEEVDAKLFGAAEWHNIPKVSVTSIPSRNNQPACYAIYWGDNDPMNVVKACSPSRPNIFHASIDSMLLALRQAIHERKLDKVIVRTDNEYLINCAKRLLPLWRNNGYKKKDGETVKHKEDLQDFDTMLSQIEVKFEKLASPNEVFNQLKGISEGIVNVNETVDDSYIYNSASNGSKTVIFVHGAFVEKSYSNSENKYGIAGYGIRFKGNESFDVKDRMAKFPYTLLRAQMYGIIKALEIAKAEGFKDIRIVSDSPMFIKYYSREWKKANGQPVANDYFYRQIAKLAKELNATFQYVKDPELSTDSDYWDAKVLAQDGLGMPIREEAKYNKVSNFSGNKWMENFCDNHMVELAKTAEEWKDVPQIYGVKHFLKDSKKFGCAVFDQSSDNSGNSFSTKDNALIGTLKLLIPILKKKIEEGNIRLVLRTNIKYIILALECFLKKWETNGYVTAQGKAVLNADVYKEISKLLKKIDLRIEYFEKPEQDSDIKAYDYCKEETEKSQNI